MEGEDERSEDNRSFSKASVPRRIAIVVAGALVNIIFATILYFTLVATSGTFISNEVESLIDGYAAKDAGIQAGDKIVKINDEEIKSKYDLDEVLESANGEELKVKVDRNGEILEYNIKPTEVKAKSTGIYLNDKAKIVTLEKGSSAERQGVQTNDEIIKINGEDINGNTSKAVEIISQSKEAQTIELTLKRGNSEVTINLVPDTVSSYYLGVNMKYAEDTFINRCINGGMQTREFLFSIVDSLRQLFTGQVGLDQMMGPVGISEAVAGTDGFREFFELMALISLSLGVTNLLPIPALDGGKLLILIIEAIRRKPLKQETEINIQLLGFSILIALSIYVCYNDILRIF